MTGTALSPHHPVRSFPDSSGSSIQLQSLAGRPPIPEWIEIKGIEQEIAVLLPPKRTFTATVHLVHPGRAELPADEMAILEAAAELKDERAFLSAKKSINWRERPPEDFIRAVHLALAAGAHLAARHLASQGAQQYPSHAELQKYARVLAPPKLIRRNLPPDPTLGANHNWIKQHGDAYRGKWIALRNGQLLATADSFNALADQFSDPQGILFTPVF